MLCVGPSHLDWNGQMDGAGKCFRHFLMQDSPQRSSDWRAQWKSLPWDRDKNLQTDQSRRMTTQDLLHRWPCYHMPRTDYNRFRENWREWIMNALRWHGHSFWVTNINNSILLCLLHYLAWSCMPTTRYHEAFLCHPTCHYCFVSGGHLVRSHEPFLGNQAGGLSWLMLASLVS